MRFDPTPRRMTAFLVLMHLFALLTGCLEQTYAQSMPETPEPLPDIVRDEIIRRGDVVENLGQVQTDSPQAYVFAALAPPPDDSHKWYISVITTENCPWCELLKKHFAEVEDLRAWVNVENQAESWAHYNVYRQEDRTQDWRWKNLRIRGYPTLILQPPRNREWGDPAAVVMQKTGYDGNARSLSAAMRKAIETYVRALQTRGELDPSAITQIYDAPYERYKRQAHQQASTTDEEPAIERGAGQPPFPVPAVPTDPRLPNPSVPLPDIPGPLDPDRKPVGPSGPDADDGERATFDELLRVLPDADPSWITRQLQRGVTLAEAQAAWQSRQLYWRIGLGATAGLAVLLVVLGVTVFASVMLAERCRDRGRSTDSAGPGPGQPSSQPGAAGSGTPPAPS